MERTLNELIKKGLAYLLSIVLVMTAAPGVVLEAQDTPSAPASSSYTGQGTPETEKELEALVAPIALYPDALVAQILAGATFPDQIAVANNWLQQNKNLTGSALGQAVNGQTWDPSVKALTQFPSVLNNMAQNLAWTSQLGEAYHNQAADVMKAVQTLRAQAKAAGNLKSGSQITVVQQTPQTIVIQPTNPQVVYVPTYNPTVIYGTPYVVPGYTTTDLVATGLLSFGAGMAVGAMMSGGCCGWGYSSWNCNWNHYGAYYGGHPYYGNDAWHGGYHPYDNGAQHYGDTNYNRNTNVSSNKVNVNRGDSGHSHFWDRSRGADSDAAKGWGSRDGDSRATAFSGYSDHSGGRFGSGGWADRSASAGGWASRGGGGGWGGGRFGGGGGFGGGGFRGGGGRR